MVSYLLAELPLLGRVHIGSGLPSGCRGGEYYFTEREFYFAREGVALRALRIMCSEASRTLGLRFPVRTDPITEREPALFKSIIGLRSQVAIANCVIAWIVECMRLDKEILEEREIELKAEQLAMLMPDFDVRGRDETVGDVRAMLMRNFEVGDIGPCDRIEVVVSPVEQGVSALSFGVKPNFDFDSECYGYTFNTDSKGERLVEDGALSRLIRDNPDELGEFYRRMKLAGSLVELQSVMEAVWRIIGRSEPFFVRWPRPGAAVYRWAEAGNYNFRSWVCRLNAEYRIACGGFELENAGWIFNVEPGKCNGWPIIYVRPRFHSGIRFGLHVFKYDSMKSKAVRVACSFSWFMKEIELWPSLQIMDSMFRDSDCQVVVFVANLKFFWYWGWTGCVEAQRRGWSNPYDYVEKILKGTNIHIISVLNNNVFVRGNIDYMGVSPYFKGVATTSAFRISTVGYFDNCVGVEAPDLCGDMLD